METEKIIMMTILLTFVVYAMQKLQMGHQSSFRLTQRESIKYARILIGQLRLMVRQEIGILAPHAGSLSGKRHAKLKDLKIYIVPTYAQVPDPVSVQKADMRHALLAGKNIGGLIAGLNVMLKNIVAVNVNLMRSGLPIA